MLCTLVFRFVRRPHRHHATILLKYNRALSDAATAAACRGYSAITRTIGRCCSRTTTRAKPQQSSLRLSQVEKVFGGVLRIGSCIAPQIKRTIAWSLRCARFMNSKASFSFKRAKP